MSEPADEELLEVFHEEATDCLAQLGRLLVELETSTVGDARKGMLREIFRLAHTIKGSAAAVGRTDLSEVAHGLESCLDAARHGTLEPTKKVIDAALLVVDLLTTGIAVELDKPQIAKAAAALQDASSSAPAPVAKQSIAKASAGLDNSVEKRTPDTILTSLMAAIATAAGSENSSDVAPIRQLMSELRTATDSNKVQSISIIQSLTKVLQLVGMPGVSTPAVFASALTAIDFLQTDLSLGASQEEADAVNAALAAVSQTVSTTAGSPNSKATETSASSGGSTPAAVTGPEASVRIPVSLLDSILYRLDELVAVKLRLDYQRKMIEESQESLNSSVMRASGPSNEFLRDVESHRRRLEFVRRDLSQEVHYLGLVAQALQEDVKDVRMVPIGPLLHSMRRIARDLAQSLGKQTLLEVEGEAVRVDKRLLELIRDPLIHLMRNAIDHGLETPDQRIAAGKAEVGRIYVSAQSRESQVWIEVRDDGKGISADAIRSTAIQRGLLEAERSDSMTDREILNLIFAPGFSTSKSVTEISGRGVGLDVVRDSVARLGGRIEFFTEVGKGTQFKLCLPLTLAASRGLLVTAGKEVYCVPLTAVDEVVSIEPSQVGIAQGQLVLEWRRQAVSFICLQDLLTSRPAVRPETKVFAIVIAISDRRLALGVEELMGQEEVVVKGLAPGTPQLPFVAGATSLADGRLVTVLEPSALVDAAARSSAVSRTSKQTEQQVTVLVADDSLTTRMMISSVLDRAGYRTLLAQDGANAYRILMQEKVDLVVSDVEMPVLDGISLVRQIRGSPTLTALPVILVTSLGSADDRARGAEAGADGYVVKKDFDPGAFLSMVVEFLERTVGNQ